MWYPIVIVINEQNKSDLRPESALAPNYFTVTASPTVYALHQPPSHDLRSLPRLLPTRMEPRHFLTFVILVAVLRSK